MKKIKYLLPVCICGLILSSCQFIQASSFGSDSRGPSPNQVQQSCGGPPVALYIGKSGGVDLVANNNPTGAVNTTGTLNYQDLVTANDNTDALSNGGEGVPTAPPVQDYTGGRVDLNMLNICKLIFLRYGAFIGLLL